jgi:3-hydroxyisobutyrate dehydrogenase-like beta-hydroxyacid dehydrogenase
MQSWTHEIEEITYGPESANIVFVETQMKSFDQLGWIGLGNMGSRLAKRLMNAGYPLMVYDRDRSKAEELASHGVEVAAGPVELAVAADVIFSCVNDGAAVRNISSHR